MTLDRMDFIETPVKDLDDDKGLVLRFREAFLGIASHDGIERTTSEDSVALFKRIIKVIDDAREGTFNMDVTLELAYHINTPRYFEVESLVKLGRKMYVSNHENDYVGVGYLADEFEFNGERVVHTTLEGAERYKTSFDLVKLRNDLAEFIGVPKCDEGVKRVVVMFNDRNDLAQICG